jgi:pyruvate,orthophosphate dikinase
MQVQAILEAACELKQEEGITVQLEIMVPLIGDVKELAIVKHYIHEVAERVMRAKGVHLPYLVGTMIELPRAVLTAGAIAREADFFSYGTNDLTQTTLGLSRDDAGMFLPHYIERGILAHDPFVVLDQEGVGELIRIGVERGRHTRPNLKVGICGEHGGEPRSIAFCHRIDLDYVSCSPFRVPIARKMGQLWDGGIISALGGRMQRCTRYTRLAHRRVGRCCMSTWSRAVIRAKPRRVLTPSFRLASAGWWWPCAIRILW